MSLAMLAIAGALALLAWALMARLARLRRKAPPSPQNAHPGRVIPAGVSVVQALRPSPEDLEELALTRKGLAPEVERIRQEKPRLVAPVPKEILRRLLDQESPPQGPFAGQEIAGGPKGELEIARRLAGRLLPGELPRIPGYDFSRYHRLSHEGRCEFFDAFHLDPKRLGFLIGEVAVGGIPGAVIMTEIVALVRSAAHGESSPAAILARVNRQLIKDIPRGMFATAFFAVLSTEDGILTSVCAGHDPMVVSRKGSDVCQLIHPHGLALGIDPGELFEKTLQEEGVRLSEGDRFTLYTSGLAQAVGKPGEMFDSSRLHQRIGALSDRGSKEFLHLLLKEVDGPRGAAKPGEGLTVLTGRRDPHA